MRKLFYKHDLGEPMQLGADTGDTVADKKTEVNGGEAVEQGGDDLTKKRKARRIRRAYCFAKTVSAGALSL